MRLGRGGCGFRVWKQVHLIDSLACLRALVSYPLFFLTRLAAAFPPAPSLPLCRAKNEPAGRRGGGGGGSRRQRSGRALRR